MPLTASGDSWSGGVPALAPTTFGAGSGLSPPLRSGQIESSIIPSPRPRSPPTRQPPDPRRDQSHRIPGRVTKVEGLAPSRPRDFFFDADAVAVQELPPAVEGFGLNAQGEMAWP